MIKERTQRAGEPNGALQQPRVRVLMVEDVALDAEMEVRELKRAGIAVEHRLVDSEERFRTEMANFDPQVIISDFSMPHFDGMTALALSRELAPDIPFIFVSGTIGEEYAIRALKNGATDYVLKSNLVRLPAAVERALKDSQDRRARRKAEKKLAETRERLRAIFETLPDAVWSISLPEERLLYISPAARAVLGHEPEAFIADVDLGLRVVHADDRARVENAWRELLAGAPYDLEYRVAHADGRIRWVHERAHCVTAGEGAAQRVDGIVRDITDAVLQRERLARLSRIREMLGATNSAIVRVRERQGLFEELCRIAVADGGFTLARVTEKDREGKVRIAATTEPSSVVFQGMIDEINRDPQGSRSLIAQVLRSGQPAVANDVGSDARVMNRAELTREGSYALALLPIVVEGRVEGALSLRAREPGMFDQEEMALLAEIVANIAFALELMGKQDKLDYLALYDPLTDLPNRSLFRDRLTQAIEAARRGGSMLALSVFDIERFKHINDALGQRAGDEVLRTIADRLRATVGDVNRVARLGGNMFAVMFPSIQDAADAARTLEEAGAEVVGRPLQVEGRDLKITAKAGIALFPDDGVDADSLFRNAEASLKRAKETGERFLFYAPHINARVAEQVDLENRLRRAIENRELFLHFQPKVELATRRIVGVEALMRWRGPDNLLMSPARFVPVLEETGMILEAGRLALEIAAAAHRDWNAQGLAAPRVAVNVSALQLRQKTFVEDVLAAVGGPDHGVDLEITESLLMQEVEASILKLKTLREAGMSIALDDFGTGHSSLSYLSRLPINTLKIDRSFVHGMTEKAEDTSIVSTIISLAQALRLKVVAEGVETEEQARMLRLLRCDEMQGYLYSPPQPREKLEELLRNPPG